MITTLTVPISVGNVEVEAVAGIEAMHCAKLGEPSKYFWSSFELEKRFTGYGVRRLVGGVPEGGVLGLHLVVFPCGMRGSPGWSILFYILVWPLCPLVCLGLCLCVQGPMICEC